MNKNARLLQQYLNELRFDHNFIELLRGSGLNRAVPRDAIALDAEELAEGWLSDIELDTGREVAPGVRSQVVRYVEGRMPGLLLRFRGNEDAARLTMANLLDTHFAHLRK